MIHSEQIDETTSDMNEIKRFHQEEDDDEEKKLTKMELGAVGAGGEEVNVSSVLDCIQRIGGQSSRINGACYYFVDDLNDCITSANISPNLEMISCSTENSSVHLYRLYENEIGNLMTTSAARRPVRTMRRRPSNQSKKSKLNSSHFINNELNHTETTTSHRQSDEIVESGGLEAAMDEMHATNVNETVEKKARYYRLFSDVPEERNHFQELIGGHTGVVFKSKFTHDSKYLMSCGEDGQACLWSMSTVLDDLRRQQSRKKPEQQPAAEEEDLVDDDDEFDLDNFEAKIRRSNIGQPTTSGRGANREDQYSSASLVCTYAGHLHPVWDLEMFSNLNLFATASNDKTARLWSFERTYPLRVYCGHQCDVNSVKFHPNGSYLATGSSDKTVRLWCAQSGDFLRLFSGHRSRVFSLAFSPDGLYLASAGEDRRVRLWDLRTGQLYKELKGHTDIVHALEFDNQSEILCSAGLDKSVKFWDIHQKNVSIGQELSQEDLAALASKKQVPSSSSLHRRSMSRRPQSTSNGSAELVRSFGVDSAVYSIHCDAQNVFYVLGARKSPFDHALGDGDERAASRCRMMGNRLASSHHQSTHHHSSMFMDSQQQQHQQHRAQQQSGMTPQQRRRTNSALSSASASVTLAAANFGLYDWNDSNII